MEKIKWKNQKQSYSDALNYIKGRQNGLITSLKTPWEKVNNATTAGLEWNSMTVVAARPGAGKTAFKDQLIRECFRLNPEMDMRVLDFSLEMVGKASAIRNMTSFVERSYKYLCSADGTISEEDFDKCHAYAKMMVKLPIDVVEEVNSVEEFEQIINDYMRIYSEKVLVRDSKTGKDVEEILYKHTIISLDHSLLINEKNKQEMLVALGACLTKLKRRYPIIFIILSQLNRSIDNPERNEDGKYGNYILESDIFGSDALLQHAETVIGLNRPGKQKIRFYGPDRYIIDDDTLIAVHFIKARNGEVGLTFFKALFYKMEFQEIDPPPRSETRSRF